MVSVYLPHSGYPISDFQSILEDIWILLSEVTISGSQIILAGDFNTSMNGGVRWESIQELLHEFDLVIANSQRPEFHPDEWTHRSSNRDLRRIDYIAHSQNLSCQGTLADRYLALGSDHRAVSAMI